MVIDTSALIAVALDEPVRERPLTLLYDLVDART